MTATPEIPAGVGLHLLLGPPNAGKLGAVLRWWARRRAERPLIVVPARGDVAEVELELLERVGVVLDEPPVRAVDQLVADLRPSGAPLIGGLRRSLLVRDIAAAASPESALGRLAAHPGGVDALLALFDELGEVGLPPARLEAAIERWAAGGGAPLREAVATAYRSYLRGLAEWGVVDRHQALAAAVEGCASWRRPVAFHGFLSFTPAQRALVHALAARVPVVLGLAVDPGRVVGGGPEEEAALFRPAAVSETVLPRQRLAFASPSVEHLEWAFLREGALPWAGGAAGAAAGSLGGAEATTGSVGPAEAAPGSVGPAAHTAVSGGAAGAPGSAGPGGAGAGLEGVRLLLSAGRRNEVELAAAEIVSLLRRGLAPGDIGVLVRRMEPWRALIPDVFGRYGLPFSLDGTVPFAATGLGHALLSVLRGLVDDDLDPLLAFLRGPYHRAPLGDVDAAEVAVRGGPRRGAAAESLELLLPGALEAVRAAVRPGGAGRPGIEPAGLLALAGGMLAASARVATPGSEGFERDARALRSLALTLAETDAIDAVAQPGARSGRGLADRPLEAALSVISALPVSLGRGDEAGVVRVTTVRRAHSRRFPVVFLLGLVDTEFPGPERREGLLSPREREVLVADRGVPVLGSGPRSEEAALFALALSRPWQLLYLSARDAQDDGDEAIPSPFWWEAARLLSGLRPASRRGLEDVVHEPDHAPTVREFLRSCAALRLTPADAEQARLLADLGPWECRPSRLVHPAVVAQLAEREVFAATELETYARCPFGWFAERAVGLETMEEDLGPLHSGSVLHRVLSRVYAGLRDAGEPRLTVDSLPAAVRAAERALADEVDSLLTTWPRAEVELMRARLADTVSTFLAFDAGSGSGLALSDVELALPAEGVDFSDFRLSGRVDRIERDPDSDAHLVVDYKSGSEVHGPDFASRGSLQVPLYALALRRLGLEVAGGLYVGLKGCVRRGAVLADVAERAGTWVPKKSRVGADGLEEELSRALAAARAAVDGIRRGEIGADPLEECPSYCALSPLCRVPRKARSW